MKGSNKVIDLLNRQLTLELTSIDQYLAHAKIYEDLGLNKLHHQLVHESEEELDHANQLIERILFLEGKPDTASREPIKIGGNVKEMLENDLEAEKTVQKSLIEIISTCEGEKDYVTREMLKTLLSDTEMDHIYWLKQHLNLIKLIGLPNYMQSQMNAATPT